MTASDPLPTAQEARAVRLAGTALHHGLNDRWAQATATVQHIDTALGPAGLFLALIAWCDTVTARQPHPNHPSKLQFLDIHTNTPINTDAVHPRRRWAGRLISARANRDRDMWNALIAALPDDPLTAGSYVGAVLECTVFTLWGLGRHPRPTDRSGGTP